MSSVHKQSPGFDWSHRHTHTRSIPIRVRDTHTHINHLAQLNMKNPFRSVVIYAVSGCRSPSSSDILLHPSSFRLPSPSPFCTGFILNFCFLHFFAYDLFKGGSLIFAARFSFALRPLLYRFQRTAGDSFDPINCASLYMIYILVQCAN